MQLELTKEERQQLMSCVEAAVKTAPSSLQAAQLLLPLAEKIARLGQEDQPKSE